MFTDTSMWKLLVIPLLCLMAMSCVSKNKTYVFFDVGCDVLCETDICVENDIIELSSVDIEQLNYLSHKHISIQGEPVGKLLKLKNENENTFSLVVESCACTDTVIEVQKFKGNWVENSVSHTIC